eukprot:scaffold40777_cov39-Prasinocladus_malaysianus.AAC.1
MGLTKSSTEAEQGDKEVSLYHPDWQTYLVPAFRSCHRDMHVSWALSVGHLQHAAGHSPWGVRASRHIQQVGMSLCEGFQVGFQLAHQMDFGHGFPRDEGRYRPEPTLVE